MKKAESFLSSISIYDHGTYLKMKNNWTTTNSCGGIATLLIILMLLGIMIMKFIEIFDKKNMTVSMQTTVSSYYVKTSVVTTQKNSSYYPFMIGVHQEGIFDISASHELGGDETPIALQNCTYDHFAGMPDLYQVFEMTEVDRMKCLPLNQTYSIGGVQYKGQAHNIRIKVSCSPSQTCSSENSIQMVSMYGIVNPFDKESPVVMYGMTRTFPFFNPGQMNPLYIMSLDKKNIKTNKAIWPFETNIEKATVHSLSDNFVLNDGGENSLKFLITSTQEEVTYERSFTTLLDGLAYIGGIYGSLISIFFFMGGYMQSFFVMLFAAEVFGNKNAKNYGFKNYLKACAAGIIGLFKTVDWEDVKQQQSIEKTVSKTLSLEYLFRRIEFLQNAVEVTFDHHHLKGLHLLRKSNREQNNELFKQYKLRERLIEYLKNREDVKVSLREQGMASAENLAVDISQERKTENVDFFSEIDGSAIEEEDSHPEGSEQQEERRRVRREAIEKQIFSDLKVLMEQANLQHGDPRSKLIFERLDSKMKECLSQILIKKSTKKDL